MGEFFKGWRRNAGGVLLVLACVFMVGWVRSGFHGDVLQVRLPSGTIVSVESGDYPRALPIFIDRRTMAGDLSQSKSQLEWDISSAPEMRFPAVSLGIAINQWFLPYWSVVIPLTLLSTYLLLINPRIAMPKKAVEPTTAEGA